jgi:DNA-binding MarR family transcriptional regulator
VEPLPDEIRQFMEANVDSLDQLEILRVLGESPERACTTAELARAAQCPPGAAIAHVNALQARGLVSCTTNGNELVAQYGPRTPELEKLLRQLLQLYRERPVTMIKLAYARARGALQDFADAFRIRKEN